MRGVTVVATKYLGIFDEEIGKCLAALLHDAHGSLPQLARDQAALPIAMGGLGIRRTRDHWSAAALASQAGNFQLAQTLDPQYAWDALRWKHAVSDYNERVDLKYKLNTDQPTQLPVQQKLSAAIVDAQADKLMLALSTRDRARMKSLLLPMSGAYLTAIPSNANMLESTTFAAVTSEDLSKSQASGIRSHWATFIDCAVE